MCDEKQFLVVDQSGRGAAVTLPASEILNRWEGTYSNDPDQPEDTLCDFLDRGEVGDTFENQDDHATVIRIV